MFVMGASVDNVLAPKALATAKEVMQSLAASPITLPELEQARSELVSQANKDLANSEGAANAWLDGETYKLPTVAERLRTLSGVTQADVQRAATRLLKDGAFASVVLGSSEVLKAQGDRLGKIEVMGELPPEKEKTAPKPSAMDKLPEQNPKKPF
jgi:predicted Zn-dependent peptidase